MAKKLIVAGLVALAVVVNLGFYRAHSISKHEDNVLSRLATQLHGDIHVVQVKGMGPWLSVRYLSVPTRPYTRDELFQIARASGELENLVAIIGIPLQSDRECLRCLGINESVSHATEVGGPFIKWKCIHPESIKGVRNR